MLVSISSVLRADTMDQEQLEKSELIVSKGFAMYLADPTDYAVQRRNFAVVAPGVRLRLFPNTKVLDRFDLINRMLVLSEDGLWGWILEGSGGNPAYWPAEQVAAADGWTNVVIVQRATFAKAKCGKFFEKVLLNGGERFKLIQGSFTIVRVVPPDSKHHICKNGEKAELYEISKRYTAGFTVGEQLLQEFINPFGYDERDGGIGLTKRCNVSSVEVIQRDYSFRASAEVSLKAALVNWLSFGLSAEASAELAKRIEETEELTTKENISVWVFKRQEQGGRFLLIRKQDCETGTQTYSFVNDENDEVVVNSIILEKSGINQSIYTGQPLITCFEEYFKLFDMLRAFVKQGEIPFIISYIAQFDQIEDLDNCAN